MRLATIVTASSTLPMLSKISYIDGKPYIDGGIGEAIPYKKAMNDGNKKIVVVLTRAYGYKEKNDFKLLNLLYRIYYRKYPTLIRKLYTRANSYN